MHTATPGYGHGSSFLRSVLLRNIYIYMSRGRKYPGGFTAPKVLEQLRYCGVLETVRIRREGYPVRTGFAEFAARLGEADEAGRALKIALDEVRYTLGGL